MTLTAAPHRLLPAIVLAVCALALAVAYTAQYGFGLEPCILCLYQRIPYAVAGLLAMTILVLLPRGGRWAAVLMAVIGVVFLVEAGIAFYHYGVEQHWWVAATGCSGGIPTGLSLEQLKAEMLKAPVKPCDQVDWTLLGQSVTVYNTAAGLALAAFSFWAAGRLRPGRGGRA